jgi:glutamyl-tRNA synthetase
LKAGSASYQLAVVADDISQGVTDVIRGSDLLPSAALQQRLHALLGAQAGAVPRWWHLPLVRDAAGKRLAKRHDALSIAGLAERGATADRIRGAVACWLGAIGTLQELTREAFLQFDMERIVRDLRARSGACRVNGAIEAWLVAR